MNLCTAVTREGSISLHAYTYRHGVVSERLCKAKSIMFMSVGSEMNSNSLWIFKAQMKWLLGNCCHSDRLHLAVSSFGAPVRYSVRGTADTAWQWHSAKVPWLLQINTMTRQSYEKLAELINPLHLTLYWSRHWDSSRPQPEQPVAVLNLIILCVVVFHAE